MRFSKVFLVATLAGLCALVGACGARAEHPHRWLHAPDHPERANYGFRASVYVAPYVGAYGSYYNPGWSSYYLPPSYVPAEQAFGPQAVRQFLGLDHEVDELAPLPDRPPAVAANALRTVEDRPPPAINLSARARARKALSGGDDWFRKQCFQDALQQYKAAATADPNFAEAYFRQGHALVATNRFDLAAAAFKRALKLRPDLDRDGFRLQTLYADNPIAKTAHLELLARRACEQPQDADAFFLVGLFLHYDGQAERAQKFFARAKTLAGAADAHLRGFLPAAKREPLALAGGVAT